MSSPIITELDKRIAFQQGVVDLLGQGRALIEQRWVQRSFVMAPVYDFRLATYVGSPGHCLLGAIGYRASREYPQETVIGAATRALGEALAGSQWSIRRLTDYNDSRCVHKEDILDLYDVALASQRERKRYLQSVRKQLTEAPLVIPAEWEQAQELTLA